MSTGTNKERISANTEIISENNADLTALKTRINNLPTSGDTTATAEDIAVGKTAVSKGVKLTGTMQPGIDTSDATATASDMASGVTAYVDGEKITGNVLTYNVGNIMDNTVPTSNFVSDSVSQRKLIIYSSEMPQNVLLRKDNKVRLNVSYNIMKDSINNFQASNIKKGVSILGVLGTYEGEGGGKVVLPDKTRFENSQATDFSWLNNVDTSNMTEMSYMFRGCYNAQTIPLIDTSSITATSHLQGIFQGCLNLTNESLNNVLQMCINTSSATGLKTLERVGLTSSQATTCQTLSNWDAFVAAGWRNTVTKNID